MAAPTDHDSWIDRVHAMHDRYTPSEGERAEVVERHLEVSPSASGRHRGICGRLHAQLGLMVPPELVVTNSVTLAMHATRERYIPDLLVMPADALFVDDWLLNATDAELVAEIVSPYNAWQDRVVKLRGYAASGVPIYLLVDPLERRVTLFTDPAGDSYRHSRWVPFGEDIELPAPFHGKIDTAAFR